MEMKSVRILAVDDNEGVFETIQDRLDVVSEEFGIEFEMVSCTDFAAAHRNVSTGTFDLAILDIREDATGQSPENGRGIELFEMLKGWAFIPTVFYTAFAKDLDASTRGLSFVRAVSKERPVELDAAVSDLIQSGAVLAAREVAAEVRNELKEFMWSQTSTSTKLDPGELRSQMFRRSSARLDMGSEAGADGVAPSRMYLIPPMSKNLECGSILREGDKWWVVATPACDLVKRGGGKAKAEFVRLLHAKPLRELPLKSRDVATGSKPRYFYLAPHGPVPELVIDLQHVRTEVNDWWSESSPAELVATLDVPYAEALIVRYAQYAGRVGTPTLDLSRIST